MSSNDTAILLKSSRLRQYLYEGCEGMVYADGRREAVPGFLHISLFLFFGRAYRLATEYQHQRVALSTIVPIGVSGFLYIFTTFAPILYPQSPYQNSFSGIFWYLIQKLRGRRFRDRRSDGEMKSVDTNMAQGQMQLAMEETAARKDRDERAIRWLIDNLTEDAEVERFLSAIPGSFNTDWGVEVWKRVGDHHEEQCQGEPVCETTQGYNSSPAFILLEHLSVFGQSFTWLGNPLPIMPLPMQRHTHQICICTLPLRISKERMLCMSSAHVSHALQRYARTGNFLQTTICGGSVRVPVSRPLHQCMPCQCKTCLVWRLFGAAW